MILRYHGSLSHMAFYFYFYVSVTGNVGAEVFKSHDLIIHLVIDT